jgi:hypothetical protein
MIIPLAHSTCPFARGEPQQPNLGIICTKLVFHRTSELASIIVRVLELEHLPPFGYIAFHVECYSCYPYHSRNLIHTKVIDAFIKLNLWTGTLKLGE